MPTLFYNLYTKSDLNCVLVHDFRLMTIEVILSKERNLGSLWQNTICFQNSGPLSYRTEHFICMPLRLPEYLNLTMGLLMEQILLVT